MDKNRNKTSTPAIVDDSSWFWSWKLPTIPDILSFPTATLGWPTALKAPAATGSPAGGPAASDDGCPVVKARDGFLRGRTLQTEDGNPLHAFRGIPFARPPVGELRFKAPQPPEPWADVRDAGQEGNICTQPVVKVKMQPKSWSLKDLSAFMATMPVLIRRVGKIFRQSEDCLYLNVYTPELPRGDAKGEAAPLRPVLFWIHGGGFLVGDGDMDMFGPDHFVDMGVVVVSINYRLGPFGFLSTGTADAPGNAGLKDQALALRWVHDNIAAFGGDPNRVTIYGESAGGVCAHLHTLSPLSRGLFHAVIAGSGTGLHEWAIASQPLTRARELGKHLGIETSSPAELAAALRKESGERLIHGCLKMKHVERFIGHELAFLPVVEPASEDAFLSEEPEAVLRDGRAAPVPVMIGVNSREGLLWFIGNPTCDRTKPHSEAEMTRLATRLGGHLFLSNELYDALTPDQRNEFHREVMDYYFGDKGLCKETLPQFVDLFGDICFINPLYTGSRLHAAEGKSPVYVYHLSFDGKLGFFKRLLRLNKYPGVSHGDELGYLFRVGLLPEIQLGPESPDRLFRQRMLKLWVNFMKTGNPTPPEAQADLGVAWTPSWRGDSMDYLDIGDTLRMRREPPSERIVFWDGLYRKYLGVSILS